MGYSFAHISDLHFFKMPKNILRLFSKRALATANYFINRKDSFDETLAYAAAKHIKDLGIDTLLITGDYTCSSSHEEFQTSIDYLKFVKDLGFHIYSLPGNHDVYTKHAEKNQRFYGSLEKVIDFSSDAEDFTLQKERVSLKLLKNNWALIFIDCSYATSLTLSTGKFSEKVETNLKRLLKSLAKDLNIALICHYPYETFRYPRAHLERGSFLEKIVEEDIRIKLFMHGHRHEHRIEKASHHLLVDSGSICLKKKSSFNIITLNDHALSIQGYLYENSQWALSYEQTLSLV